MCYKEALTNIKYPQYCLFVIYTCPLQVDLFNSNVKSTRKNVKTGVRKKIQNEYFVYKLCHRFSRQKN